MLAIFVGQPDCAAQVDDRENKRKKSNIKPELFMLAAKLQKESLHGSM